jgi:hypothetical protein
VLSGCGSDTKTEPSTSASASKTTSTTSAKAAPSSKPKVAPRDEEAGEYMPSIVALVSKLTGNVEPQKIIDLAPGELNNLPGLSAMNEGEVSTLGEYPAYQLGGTWTQDGETKIVAQKTVVIPGDGLYVLQLNADGRENQGEIVGAATDVIDSQTTITP